MKELRESKRTYKNRYEQWQKYKKSLTQATASAELIKAELSTAYCEWSGNNTETENGSLNATGRPYSSSLTSIGIIGGE